jgi:hypothetical protein
MPEKLVERVEEIRIRVNELAEEVELAKVTLEWSRTHVTKKHWHDKVAQEKIKNITSCPPLIQEIFE